MGHRLPAAGRHVQRDRGDRRPRRAAGLLPRARRMPRVALGFGCAASRRPDGEDRLPRRPHPDRQGLGARAPREREPRRCRRWCLSATPWRSRSTICAPRPASLACSACRPSCSRRATMPLPSRRSARSRGCRAAPIAGSTSARRMNSPSCCAQSRPTPPAASRRSPTSRRATTAARVKLLAQLR